MSSKPLNSHEEYLKKKKRRKLIKRGLILFVFLSFIAGLSYASYRPHIRISNIETTGETLISLDDIKSKSLAFISGSYFWLFPKNNSFLYPNSKLENHLKDTFKRIDSVSVGLKDLKTLKVDIVERKPDSIWCDNLTPENCYFMDKDGVIFDNAPQFSGDAYFKHYGFISGEPIGKQYMASTTQFKNIKDFVSTARLLSLKPVYITVNDKEEFTLVIAGGGKIYFDMREPMERVISNFEALFRIKDFATSTTKNLEIDYIDLRFGNKLFYKLK